MRIKELQSQIALGEDSKHQFKVDVRNADSLASEMSAFANSEGGTIYLGVADNGKTPGLDLADITRINQLISNAASQLVKSPLTVRTENVALKNGRAVIVLSIPKGLDKPYFDKNGVIWLKTGADKRRVNSKEELRRLFQITDQFHADELPTKAGIDKLDKLRFRDFLNQAYNQNYPDDPGELTLLLQNMNLATDEGKLNLAGLLMFSERPELIKPQFVIKAIRYPGNQIHPTEYVDTEDFAGPLPKIFENAIAFVMRNLHKVQAGRGVNSPGQSEIPKSVFEELLVNALVHRDYLVSAPVRLFIFDNRIEIVSPGHLPNNLTVEKIRTGNSNIRNPILVSYVAKGLLPYHGLGSGIKRALADWPEIDFADDRDGCLFTAIIHRNAHDPLELVKISPKSSLKTDSLSEKGLENVGKESGICRVRVGKTSGKNRKNVGKASEKGRVSVGKDSEKRRVSVWKTSGKTQKNVGKAAGKVLEACGKKPSVTIPELAEWIGITERSVQRNIQRLQKAGLLRRVGGRKGGHWEVVE